MDSLPIVPFGKYKGQPITSLINDTKYLEWCKLQDWFQKFPVVYNICVNQTITTNDVGSKTPEHNKLQNLFLERKFNIEFVNHIYRFDKSLIILEELYGDEEYKIYYGVQKFNSNYYGLEKTLIYPLFEAGFNWDVCLLCGKDKCGSTASNGNIITLNTEYYHKRYAINEKLFKNIKKRIDNYEPTKECDIYFADLCSSIYVEIKPLLGDDYPNVLRKMNTQIKLTNDKKGVFVLFINEYSSSTTTKEQLVAIFSQSNIRVVFKKNISSYLPSHTTIDSTFKPKQSEIITPEELQPSKKSKTMKDYFHKM